MIIREFIAKKLNVKSPSREFKNIGFNISIGFRLGIMTEKLKHVDYKRPITIKSYRYTEPYGLPDNALTLWQFMKNDYLYD